MPRRRLRYEPTDEPKRRGHQYEGQPSDGMEKAQAGYQTLSKHTPGDYPNERKSPGLRNSHAPYPDYED